MYKNIIAMWSGTLGNIPAGWQLCDGTNETPDLNRRFVIGSQGSYAIGATGGTGGHSHNFTSSGHKHGTELGPGFDLGNDYHAETDTVEATGTTDVVTNDPPWYALAFIMRMS